MSDMVVTFQGSFVMACAMCSLGGGRGGWGRSVVGGGLVGRRGRERLEQRGIVEHARDQFLRAVLAIHEDDEIGELRARLQQLRERVDLARDGGGRKIVER